MSRKSVLSVISLSLLCSFANAQTLKTWQSPEITIEGFNNYIVTDANGHYTWEYRVYKKGQNFIRFNHFDHEFNLKLSKEVAVDRIGPQETYGVFKFGQQFAWLMGEEAKGGNQPISIVPITPDGVPKQKIKLFETSERGFQEGLPDVVWTTSADGSKLLVVATKSNPYTAGIVKQKPLETYLAVLGSDYKPLWQKSITWERPDKQTKTGNWTLTDSGDVLFTAEYFEEEDLQKHVMDRDAVPSKAHLFKLSNAAKQPMEIPLYEGPGHISGCTIYTGPSSDDAACACFYSDTEKGGFHGLVYFGISVANAKVTTEKKIAFDKELVGQFGQRNTDTSGDGIRSIFELQHISPLPNGNVLLYAEATVDVQESGFNGNNSTTSTARYRGDIAILELDTKGDIARKAVLHRNMLIHGFTFNGSRFEKDFRSQYVSTLNKKGRFLLDKDGQVCVRYYQRDYDSGEVQKTLKPDLGTMTLGTLAKDGKVTNQPMKELEGPSTGPAPTLPLGNPLAYRVSCKPTGKKSFCFELHYLADEVR